MNNTVARLLFIFIILIIIGILYTTSTRYNNNKYNINNNYEPFNLLNINDINNTTLTDNMRNQTGGYPQLFRYNYDISDSNPPTTEYNNMHFDMYSDIIYLGNNL